MSSESYIKKRLLVPAALAAVVGLALTGCQATDDAKDTSVTAESKAPAATKAPATKPKPKPAAPAIVTTSKAMIAVLEANALKAKNTYKGKRVTVTGFVGNIDASGEYFSLDPEPDALILTGIQVQLDDKFKDQVANFSKNQKVTVTGKVDDVGEIMGYSIQAETIK